LTEIVDVAEGFASGSVRAYANATGPSDAEILNERLVALEKRLVEMQNVCLLGQVDGLLDRIKNVSAMDIHRFCGGVTVDGGRWSFPFTRYDDCWEWMPPSGVSATGALTSWKPLPDNYHDRTLVEANRVEIVFNVARIMSWEVGRVLYMMEQSRHPLEVLAREAE